MREEQPAGSLRPGSRAVRVAFVSHLSGHYGAERVLLEAVAGLSAKKVECCVLLPPGGTLGALLVKLGVPCERAPIRWWASDGPARTRPLRLAANLAAAAAVARRLARLDVDLVYSNSSVSPTGALAAWLLRKPHVWHVHEFAEEDHGLSFDLGRRLAYTLIGRLSRCVVANSEAVRAKCLRFMPSDHVRTVYAGVRSAPLGDRGPQGPSWERGPVTALVVGKIKESKGQMEAVRAVGELVREGLDLNLVLAGSAEEPYSTAVRRLVADAGLERRVRFAGDVPDVTGLVQEAHVVLVCSRSEAFGMAAVEAMHGGKPVIGARGGATPELVRDGENGLLYALGDPRDLARKLRHLMQHPDAALRMGAAGRRWAADTFSPDRFVEEILTVIEEALGKGRAA